MNRQSHRSNAILSFHLIAHSSITKQFCGTIGFKKGRTRVVLRDGPMLSKPTLSTNCPIDRKGQAGPSVPQKPNGIASM
jgi:hypothetical protein